MKRYYNSILSKIKDNLLYLSGVYFKEDTTVNNMTVWNVYYNVLTKENNFYKKKVEKSHLIFKGLCYIHEFPLKHKLIVI